jgi:hypothetical protein
LLVVLSAFHSSAIRVSQSVALSRMDAMGREILRIKRTISASVATNKGHVW